ncbi:hypothetical protein [Streptomyces sp. NRRL F-2664]|uniref:hypothetical protein n=1 Tax=Streptomyces sp. NRRL F-2664 TaxID=1463842 RepID=UPI0004C800CC|nr:hypothetical protein [Streptomyces sp. NRRL F-2664]
MARIRMLTSVSGRGFVWDAGQEIDLPGAEAAVWADGVRAELVRDTPIETPEATTARPERTARRPRTTNRSKG